MSQPPEPIKPFGNSLGWDDAMLDRLAEVTDADIAAAREHWILYAPRRYKSLLDAIEVEEE